MLLPDNNNTWYFCAYHGAVYDGAGNIALYSVEPYQNVSGCNVGPGTPNGQLADSTNNVLSHEEIETITDPFGDAWWNRLNLALHGEEIADECAFLLYTPTDVFWDPSVVRLNHKQYALQPEYSNSQHACTANARLTKLGRQQTDIFPGGIPPLGILIFSCRWG